jgi:hypothetical protein
MSNTRRARSIDRARLSFNAGKSRPGGRLQTQLRRAFISSSGKPLGMSRLLEWCYPATKQHPRWHRTNIRRALLRHAVNLGRIPHRRGRPGLYGPNAELVRLIRQN